MNEAIITSIAEQAIRSNQLVAHYPDPNNDSVTFPPSPYYRFFYFLAKKMQARLSVELGVCGGGGVLHLAMGSKIAVGIDVTYNEYVDNMNWLRENYANLTLFIGDSVELAPIVYDRFGAIDILFIDTTHTYEQTMAEYNAYQPFLSDRVVVCLDDLYRPGMDKVWAEMPINKMRFDYLHPSQAPTDGGFGVVWK